MDLLWQQYEDLAGKLLGYDGSKTTERLRLRPHKKAPGACLFEWKVQWQIPGLKILGLQSQRTFTNDLPFRLNDESRRNVCGLQDEDDQRLSAIVCELTSGMTASFWQNLSMSQRVGWLKRAVQNLEFQGRGPSALVLTPGVQTNDDQVQTNCPRTAEAAVGFPQILVDLNQMTVTVGSETFKCRSKQALQWLKILCGHPNRWLKATELHAIDSTVVAFRTHRLKQLLPACVQDLIETDRHLGSRLRLMDENGSRPNKSGTNA